MCKEEIMAKKEKKEKVKSVLGVPVDFDLGKKIRQISMDKDKYKVANLVLLILMNIVLVGTIGYLLSIMHNALLIAISIFTITVCLAWSIISYKKGVINIKYTIHENAVVKDYDNSSNVGVIEKLIGIRVATTFLDKLGNNKTKTLILRFDNKWCTKLVLHCVTEDVDDILDTINTLRMRLKSKIAIKQKDEKPLIKRMINIKTKK